MRLSADAELHWLALHLVPGLGTKKTLQLLEAMGSPEAIFRSSPSELAGLGVPEAVARTIVGGCTFDDAVTQQGRMKASEAVLIPFEAPEYPMLLRQIPDPPLVLFGRGRVELLHSISIGVVGTRRPTAYGTAASTKLSRDLAEAGVTVTSGMARGIDTAAHRGALDVGGNTVAIFGCAVDVVYPAENRKLADEIANKGFIASEFPLGTPAYPQNFPIRNRIVSGISRGVLVVEGAQYSGSAITARLAVDQGRELFAVPGNITSKMSWSPNLLIKQGAKLVQDVEDILVELKPSERREMVKPQMPLPFAAKPEIESAPGRAIYSRVAPDEPTHIDTLFNGLPQYSSSELIAALFELEVAGLVRQLAGQHYIRVW